MREASPLQPVRAARKTRAVRQVVLAQRARSAGEWTVALDAPDELHAGRDDSRAVVALLSATPGHVISLECAA